MPSILGLFTKIDHEGWTGIASINTAYNNSGETVAVETIQVVSGAKVVKPVEEIFTQSVAGATYVSYTSDHGVVGFFSQWFR